MKKVFGVCFAVLLMTACVDGATDAEPSQPSIEASGAEPSDHELDGLASRELDEISTQSCDQLATPDRDVLTGQDVASYRYYLSWGACHTYGWMQQQASQYCSAIGYHFAYQFNFTYYCQGWWGEGARKVWFTCARFN